jgi:hypothetical protein
MAMDGKYLERGAIMKTIVGGYLGALAMLVAVVAFGQTASAGEDATITAFMAWQGQGRTFQTGAKDAEFVGAIVGRIYTETDKGPIASGLMECPAMLTIGLENGRRTGSGRCMITAKDGSQIYAEVSCRGVYMVGCDGELKLTGGSGRFKGISGGGPVIIRSDQRQITAISAAGVVGEQGGGILYLRSLHYTLP